MTEVERLAAAIRAWLELDEGFVSTFVDELAAHLIQSGVRWVRPVEDVELPGVNE